jgi:hypothetical protein
MHGGPLLAPEAKGFTERDGQVNFLEEVPAWDMESSPRLHETDLADPEIFHRRLIDWIMNQK